MQHSEGSAWPMSNSRKPLRARKACNNCQARKSKCVQTYENTCDRCRRNRKVCAFTDFPPTSSATRMGSQPSPITPPSGPQWMIASDSRSSPGSPHWGPSSSTAVGSADTVPDVLSGHIPSHDSRRTQVEGKFLSHVRRLMFLEPKSSSRECSRPRSQSEDSSSGLSDPGNEAYTKAVSIFPPQHVAQYLLAVVADYAVDSFFYYDQRELERALAIHNTNAPQRSNPSFACLALSAFAMGMQWAHLDDRASEPVLKAVEAADAFATRAQELVPTMLLAPSTDAVSAFLLLCLYLLTTVSTDSAYSYLGMALRIGIASNMHKKSPPGDFTPRQAECRHRLWWTVYSLERTIGVKLGRPETIQEQEMSTPLPSYLAELDEGQRHDNLSQQIANATLVRTMSRIANAIPSIYAQSALYNHNMIGDLVAELDHWRSTLPDDLQLHNLDPLEKGYRGKMHLHQNYNHALIILYRTPMITAARQRLGQMHGGHEPSNALDPQAMGLAMKCSISARSIIANFDRVRQSNLLARFSWTDFQGCSTAVLMMLFYHILDHDIDYEHSIVTGLHILRVLAEASKPARLALNFVQEFKKIVEEAVQLSERPQNVRDTVRDTVRDRRRNYKRWLTSLSISKSSGSIGTDEHRTPAAVESWDETEQVLTDLAGGTLDLNGAQSPPLPDMLLDTDAFFDESKIVSLSGMDFLASSSYFFGDQFQI